jgi:hypothetical protein
MVTRKDKESFNSAILPNFDDLLSGAIDWIKGNMSPEDVFDDAALSEWAEANGYMTEEQDDD